MRKALCIAGMVVTMAAILMGAVTLTGIWTGRLVVNQHEYTFTMNMNDRTSQFDARETDPVGLLRYSQHFLMNVQFDSTNRVLNITHTIDPENLAGQHPERVINHFSIEMTGFYYAYTSGVRVMTGLFRFNDILLFTDPGQIEQSRMQVIQGNWSARPANEP